MKNCLKPLLAVLASLCLLASAYAAEIPNTSVFSQTDGSNNSGTVPTWAEGMAPSQVNDSARALQGAITREWNWSHPTITSGGSANTQTLTYSVAPAAYYNGMRFCFEAGFTTTAASTLNANSLGAVAIKSLSAGTLSDTGAGTITAGDRPCVTYRSTGPSFVIEGGGGGFSNPMTTQGDVIYGGASGAATRLAVGTSNQVLRSDGTNPDWESINTLVAGKHSIWIPAGAMIQTTTNGCATATTETTTNDVMYATKDCDSATDEFADFSIQMPKSWNESTVTVMFSWTASTAADGTDDVIWGAQCLALSNDDALDQAMGTAQVVTDTLIAVGDVHKTSETAAITCAGTPAQDDTVFFKIYRDANAAGDNYSADAKLLGARVLYNVDAATDD
jgi:hypothetical protein